MSKIKIYIIICLTIFLIISIIIISLFFRKKYTSTETNTINQSINLENDINKRIMLADILKQEDEILITEDNIDKTMEIISRANLKKGIFIAENSRNKFIEIVNTATENDYSIDDDGYLKKPSTLEKETDLTKKINNYIDSDKTMVINISSTYKGLLNGMQLDFMIEKTDYVQVFEYDNTIKIAIINPDRIDENSEDLTQKEIYEEVLINM